MLIDMHLRVNSIADSHFVKIVQVFKKYIGNVPISWSLVRGKKNREQNEFHFPVSANPGETPLNTPHFYFRVV